jgi:RNA polymerase sigma factor (sigma-70 family)
MRTPAQDSRISPPTNLSLLGRMRSGEASAWSEFDRFHRALILHWARSLGCGEELGEDVCQEAMVSLFRALPSFVHDGRRGGFHAFLKTLVRSRAVDALRRRNRAKGGRDAEAPSTVPESVSDAAPAALDDMAWLRTLVEGACARAFERLDSTTYRSFCLYVIDGVAVEETARRLGVERPATVYQQKSRVLQAIREAMREILAELDDPELREGAAGLRGPSAIRFLSEFVAGNSDVRLTVSAAPQALARLALARQAVEQCTGRADGPWLVVGGTRVVPLGTAMMVIGSRDADLVLDSPGVSGRHCVLTRETEGWVATDQQSRNGLLITGRRVERIVLVDGDVLALGGEQLVFLTAAPAVENSTGKSGGSA